MRQYNFVARDNDRNLIQDLLDANSRYEAMGILKERGLTVVSLSTSSDRVKLKEDVRLEQEKKKPFRQPRISSRELSVFCRQLSVLINAGIPMIKALQSIAEDMENPNFQKVLSEIVNDVRGGQHFSEALTKYNRIFPPIFMVLMKSAEESGTIHTTLEYLSIRLEKSQRLQQKIQSITAYPIFILGFFCIVLLIITLFVLPRFENIFSSFDAELPKLTRMVFALNSFIVHNIALIVAAVAALVFGLVFYNRTPKGRYHIDRFKLNMTFFGKLIKKSSLARFCRNLSAMLGGGVAIEKALRIAGRVCNNKALEESLEKARERILAGSAIADSLEVDRNFPRLLVRMVGVGESSGRLVKMLDKIAEIYEDEVEGTIMVATSLFEPMMIVVFGGVVLVVVLAIYVPVFKIATHI